MNTLILTNGTVSAELDTTYPQVLSYVTASGNKLSGGCAEHGSLVGINGSDYAAQIDFSVKNDSLAQYRVCVPNVLLSDTSTDISFVCEIELCGNSVHKTITDIKGDFENCGMEITFKTPLLKTDSSKDSIAVSYNHLDDCFSYIGSIEDTEPFDKQECGFAFMWNSGAAAAVYTPHATHCPYGVLVTEDKDASISAGTYYHRFIDGHRASFENPDGTVEEYKYSVIVGIVEDVNSNGVVDWQDAAIWLKEMIPKMSEELKEFLRYGTWGQIHLAFPKAGADYHSAEGFTIVYGTLKQYLEMQKQISNLTFGRGKRSYQMVGWQGRGHDYGWPDLSEQPFNPAIGNVEYFNSFKEQFEKYGGDLSFHINQSDLSDYTSAIYRRGAIPHPLGNATIRTAGQVYPYQTYGWCGFAISHYKDFTKGSAKNRQDSFIDKYFAPFIMYSDVMTTRAGLGYRKVEDMYAKARMMQHWRAKGIHMATEYYEAEKYLNGQHIFNLYKQPDIIELFMLAGNANLNGTRSYKPSSIDRIFGIIKGYSIGTEVDWYLAGSRFTERITRGQYMGDMLNGFLREYDLLEYTETEDAVQLRYSDDVRAECRQADNSYKVVSGDTLIADSTVRLIPDLRDKKTTFVFSLNERTVNWKVPKIYDGCDELYLFRLSVNGKSNCKTIKLNNNTVELDLKPNHFYLLTSDNSVSEDLPGDLAKDAFITSSVKSGLITEDFNVFEGMKRVKLTADKSPDGDWRKTIMMINDIMADEEGNAYYYYPCCSRTVSDGDDDTAWEFELCDGKEEWIEFDFEDECYDINSVEIDASSTESLNYKLIGTVNEDDILLYEGSETVISPEAKQIRKLKIVISSDKNVNVAIKRISIF